MREPRRAGSPGSRRATRRTRARLTPPIHSLRAKPASSPVPTPEGGPEQ